MVMFEPPLRLTTTDAVFDPRVVRRFVTLATLTLAGIPFALPPHEYPVGVNPWAVAVQVTKVPAVTLFAETVQETLAGVQSTEESPEKPILYFPLPQSETVENWVPLALVQPTLFTPFVVLIERNCPSGHVVALNVVVSVNNSLSLIHI